MMPEAVQRRCRARTLPCRSGAGVERNAIRIGVERAATGTVCGALAEPVLAGEHEIHHARTSGGARVGTARWSARKRFWFSVLRFSIAVVAGVT